MADFYQNGIITTLHNLVDRPIEALEAELVALQGTIDGVGITIVVF